MRPTLTTRGVGMSRAMRLVGGGFAAVLITPWIGGVVAHAASSLPPLSGDPRATSVAGNAVTCADVGFADDSQLGASDSSGNSGSGFTVTSDDQNLTVSAVPADTTIDVLIVKGGDAYNVYPAGTFTTLPATGLHAPLVGNGNVPVISHWFLCYGPTRPQPEVTPPSATATGDCDVADFTLDAGSNATDFVITRVGDVSGSTYSLGADDSLVVHVPLDVAHPGATATAGGTTLKTFTRDSAICDVGNGGGDTNNNGGGDNNNGGGGDNNGGGGDNNGGGGGNNGGGGGVTSGPGSGGSTSGGAVVTNPAASASNACRTGITVSLSNLAATAPVTFTLTAPDGTVSTETVDAGDTATRSFPVTEDTTGTVTVSAPGLSARTFTYAKDCVTVLGVKHTRHHATHRATQHEAAAVIGTRAQLPFTGFNSRRTATDGALVLGLGIILCLVAGRRERSAA